MTPASSEHEDISGVWRGSYTSDKIPQPVSVVLMFQQLTTREFEASRRGTGPSNIAGEAVVGVYKSEDGAIGTIAGSIDGSSVALTATQTTPTCPGSFELQGTLVGDEFSWQFDGQDCLGDEKGQGSAKRA